MTVEACVYCDRDCPRVPLPDRWRVGACGAAAASGFERGGVRPSPACRAVDRGLVGLGWARAAPASGRCRRFVMKIPDRTGRCECDWVQEHHGEPCRNESADHGAVRTSPELCMPCLFVCCAERDDAAEAAS